MKKLILNAIFVAVFNSMVNLSFECMINDKLEGYCTSKTSIQDQIVFCKNYIPDYVCVPYESEVWPEWTISSIDSQIESTAIPYLENEFVKETSLYSNMPLINIIGCLDAYLYFICKSNFKLCDMTTDVTFDMCQSVCQTFQNTCQTNSAICQSLSSSQFSTSATCFS